MAEVATKFTREFSPAMRSLCSGAVVPVLVGLSLVVAGCTGNSGSDPSALQPGGNAALVAVHSGMLADVYGLSIQGGATVVELYQTDVLVGPDIQDERPSDSTKRDEEIKYDFTGANPDSLQPRLLITRQIGSAEFQAAYDALDDKARQITPMQFGQGNPSAPYSVVPRNAGLRLTFARPLGITDDFFVEKDTQGRILVVKNSEAIQLLKIKGDPNDKTHGGDFQVIPTRISVRKNEVFVDPVLLGSEGLQLNAKNTAAGMPESPDQEGSNIRLAVALEGSLAISGIQEDPEGKLLGYNNSVVRSIIRDFRSGNRNDNSADISRGFIRDPLPPRVVGNLLMYLEKVDSDGHNKILTIWKGGLEHEIDRGDVIRLYAESSGGLPEAVVEVLQDPEDDLGEPDVQYVRVAVRPVLGLNGEDILEGLDPTPAGQPTYPFPRDPQHEEFLRASAPKAVLATEFTALRTNPKTGLSYGDDPRYFITFNPAPISENNVFLPNQNISPSASAVIRFNKPVDLSTVRALDSMFFATRNVLDKAAIDQFIADRKMESTTFSHAKFRTPHLIYSRVFDEDGSQTTIRLQPTLGFYLDQPMRDADRGKPFEEKQFNYFMHLVGGDKGVKDLSGNKLDFQATGAVKDDMVIEFSLDTRNRPSSSVPRFADNIAVSIVRRYEEEDEDERPSYYLTGEVTPPGGQTGPDAYTVEDLFGPVAYLETGELVARQTARVQRIVDNVNQVPAPPQNTKLRWCPETVSGSAQVITPTGTTRFGQPIQNPLNPYGCRLQTVWREIDMSLSRTDGLDLNLDVEQMYWAPFSGGVITYDEFDRVSLYLGHSEFRPEPCISTSSAFPSMPNSGLQSTFAMNYARNMDGTGKVEYQPAKHPAYEDEILGISPKDVIREPNGINRFLPLPKFKDATGKGFANPFFVWRDEMEVVQGGINGLTPSQLNPYGYIISPFLAGMGRRVTGGAGSLQFNTGSWYSARNMQLNNSSQFETFTDGLVGSIALPLLADFWTYPDSPELPEGDPFLATGANGWQISLAATSSPRPNFRAYSAGWGGNGGQPTTVDPSSPKWRVASGGFTPGGGTVQALDNSVYWIMADFLKRTAVITSGFVEILNPHRMPAGVDPRLGPYAVAPDQLPDFSFDFEPPLQTLPAGTAVVPEFRGASVIDDLSPSPWPPLATSNKPTVANFPLDPRKAGDAHIRHWDERSINGGTRRSWAYLYTRNLTSYTEDPNQVVDTRFTNKFGGPSESFTGADVKYFNWRFIMRNNVEANPPVSPKIESFAVTYRFIKK